MTESDSEKAVVAHLKKTLRALHMALAAAIKAEYGHMVIDPIRLAIREIHVSLDVVQDRV